MSQALILNNLNAELLATLSMAEQMTYLLESIECLRTESLKNWLLSFRQMWSVMISRAVLSTTLEQCKSSSQLQVCSCFKRTGFKPSKPSKPSKPPMFLC